jgi:zinc transport system permease protein
VYIIFYNRIFAVTFDEKFSKATGTKAGLYNVIIAVLTALTVVLGMRIMGTLLISSLIIFPSLTAMQLCKNFKAVVITASVLSVVCFFVGISVSFLYSTPTGASIVIVNLVAFILFVLIRKLKS